MHSKREWTKEEVLAENPRPRLRVTVEGYPLCVWGDLVTVGNNVAVVVPGPGGKTVSSRSYSWDLVLHYLSRDEAMAVDAGHEPNRTSTPGMAFWKHAKWLAKKEGIRTGRFS
jgi:hypothetical protein